MFNAQKGHLGVFRRGINDFDFFELILDLDRLPGSKITLITYRK
jgi:hypothetical protein